MSNTALNRTTVALLTNKSGGSVAQGDVVIVDSATASAFTTTTTSAYVSGSVGVVLEPNGIASNAIGTVAFGGYVPLVNLSGSASLGDVFKTHTVAKQAVRHAGPIVAGDFGQVLGTGTTPAALLWGEPSGSGGGSGTVTSVDMTVPNALLSVANNPITTSGTLALDLPTRAANLIFAGPATGAAAAPAFRALVGADLPTSATSTPYPAGELGYTQITTASLSTSSGSLVDLTGVTVTVTIGSRPVVVSAYIPQWSHSAANARALFALIDVTASNAQIQGIIVSTNASGNGSGFLVSARVNPGAGSRTYKVQFEAVEAGTVTSNAGSTKPAYIQVVEV